MRLMNYNIDIKSAVGLGITVPIWQTEITLPDISDLKDYIESQRSNISGCSTEKDKQREGHVSWDSYNVVSLDLPSMQILKASIASTFEAAKRDLNIQDQEVRINGWINLLEQGDYIPLHFHAVHENSFLTGTLNISDHTTTTTFILPVVNEEIEISSFSGTITFFPQWLPHYVKETSCDRYTLAFDFFNKESWDYYNKFNDGVDWPIARSIPL